MCEDTYDTRRLLLFTSVTELNRGNRHCNLNDGRQHFHVIKAENRRHEIVLVHGIVKTHSQQKQIEFSKGGPYAPTWSVDFQALGQRISSDSAETLVGRTHSPTEDIIAELEYSFDDPFEAEADPVRLAIRVNL